MSSKTLSLCSGSRKAKTARHQTRRALRQKVSAHRSRGIGGDEAADFDIAAKADIPNDGFAKRVSGVSNDRLFRHLPPQPIDWNPISSPSHVVLRAMPIGNVAAGNASRAAHAFEPSASNPWTSRHNSMQACTSSCLAGRTSISSKAQIQRRTLHDGHRLTGMKTKRGIKA